MTRRSPTALLALAALTTAAHAQGAWTLIDRDLNHQPVELTRIAEGKISYVDRDGELQTTPIQDAIALIHERAPENRPPRELPWITRQLQMFGQDDQQDQDRAAPYTGALELTDDQRWIGQLVGGRGQRVTWLVEDTLLLDAALDQIRTAAIQAPIESAAESWRGLDDRLILTNGDVLDGYLDDFADNVRFEYDGKETNLPAESVAGLLLANPDTQPSGILLRTRGGSVISVSSLDVTLTGQVSAEVGGVTLVGSLGLRTGELDAIDLAPHAYTALAALEPFKVSAPEDSPWTTPPRPLKPGPLGSRDLELRGPVTIEWGLPKPAARFAATATLPPAMWAWGDCELVIRTADGTEAFRQRLHADRPTADINVPLGGMTAFSIEIDPGQGGPVQDTIVLERPIIAWR